jgi:hypothetical protein
MPLSRRGRPAIAPAVVAAGLLAAALAGPAPAGATIPSFPPPGGLPAFTGAPAVSHPVYSPAPPANPFMAPDGRSNIHADAYMSDTNQGPGPLGNQISVSSLYITADCASVAFDGRGRIVSVCVSPAGPTLRMIDPHSLHELAAFSLPGRNLISTKTLNIFQDFGGGGYFYLDNHDRAVVPTTSRHIYVIGETPTGAGFTLVHDYDLSGVVGSSDEITSTLPDWHGRLWFETFDGIVGTVDPATGAIHSVATHEETENSFAVDSSGGVYVVTTRAMYRWDARSDGQPAVTWRVAYPNSGVHKPGQVDAGSGTTPTVMGSGYVAITDNGDPMDVVVYRRARRVRGSRVVCVTPVFAAGASDTENSLIGTDDSMVVENNYGYSGPLATELGRTTTPGLERVDIDPGGHGCHVVWRSSEIAPTVVPKLSLSSGLVYAYTKPADPRDPWFLTALSFATGRTVYRQLAGDGLGYNNNYAPVTLGPDGTAYVGVLGGLVEFRDATPPPYLRARPSRRHATRRHAARPRTRRRHRRR